MMMIMMMMMMYSVFYLCHFRLNVCQERGSHRQIEMVLLCYRWLSSFLAAGRPGLNWHTTAGGHFRTGWITWLDRLSRNTRFPWKSRFYWCTWTFRSDRWYWIPWRSRWNRFSRTSRRYGRYRNSRLSVLMLYKLLELIQTTMIDILDVYCKLWT